MGRQANALFDTKTIKRLCSDVQITEKQKDAVREWLKLLDEKRLEDETKNYFRFGQIILQDILGYPIKDIDFETDNVEFTFTDNSGKKVVCFEAKGTSTKDLFAIQHRIKKEQETPIKQTWDNMGRGYDYGICTNYQDFVLLSKDVGYYKYHKFNFLSVRDNDEKLKEFIGIFSRQHIIEKTFVKKLYDESIVAEREFTKEFYKLFHETRLMLIKEFTSRQDVNKQEAIHYAQIYLNRLIFMFFAEDHNFIPDRIFTNRILDVLKSTLVSEHSKLVSDEISGLFKALDKGSKILSVFGFNGGLFEKEIPSKIFFSDLKDSTFFIDVSQQSKLSKKTDVDEITKKILKKYGDSLSPIIKNLLIMDSFDFTSEVNVNILGHIFEQSITDLEEISEQTVSKRKREGVYYTPEYITDHICRNTIIPYLSKNTTTTIPELVKEYSNNIKELEEKIRNIKILDPACGSGAFLIKAVDILLEIDKEIEKYRPKAVMEQRGIEEFSQVKEIYDIIENNVYGVDINEESVEITKLSLFLKLAGANRKLISLSKNIKIGNSLIDNRNIDEKAFDWIQKFPEVMQLGRFDIIIGNPPYVVLDPKMLDGYEFVKGNYNTYVAFIERALRLVKDNGRVSLIVPTTWLSGNNFEELRKELLINNSIEEIIQLPYDIFQAYIDTVIITIKKSKQSTGSVKVYRYNIRDKAYEKTITRYELVDSSKWLTNQNHNIILDTSLDTIYQKYKNFDNELLGKISKINRGTLPPKEKDLLTVKKNEKFTPWFNGQIYRYSIIEGELVFVDPAVLGEGKPLELFTSTKILGRQLVSRQFRLQFAFFEKFFAFKKNLYAIYQINNNYDPYFLLAILNSKFFSFIHVKANVSVQRDDFPSFSLDDFRNFLIPKISLDKQKLFIDKAKHLSNLTKNFDEKIAKIKNRISVFFKIDKLTNKLEEPHKLDFSEFLDEIKKKSKISLTLKEQDEWEDYFNEYKKELNCLEQEMNVIDGQIDELVYKTYGLTESEISMIEENLP